MKKNILIVDDEEDIRDLMRLYLEKHGYEVLEAANGVAGLDRLAEHAVDLTIIDIMMPLMDGYKMIAELRKDYDIPVIALSAKGLGHEKILGLDLGADDYVVKPFDPLEVLARVNAHLRRRANGAEEVKMIAIGKLQLNLHSCTLLHNGEEIELTSTEFKMMKLFAENPRRVFTKQQIYEAGWNSASVVDDNTVMVAISKLRGKLQVTQDVSIKTIRGLGYRLEVDR